MRVVILLALLCGIAEAHPLDTAYLRVEAHGSILELTFDLDVALASQELHVQPGDIDGALVTRGAELAGKLYRERTPATTEPCTWGALAASRKGVTVTLRDSVRCPPGNVRWELSFGKRLATTFQILGKVIDADGERVITIDKKTTELAIATGDALGFGSGLASGLEAAGVLPSGWKHGHPGALDLIALVIVLLLGARGFARQARDVGALLAGIVVGGLAGGLLSWGGMPWLLALAIAGTAVTVVLDRLERQRWLLAALAGVLLGAVWHEPRQPLGYALGLAIGGGVVLVLIGPLVGLCRRERPVGRWLVPALAVVLGALGAGWVSLLASWG